MASIHPSTVHSGQDLKEIIKTPLGLKITLCQCDITQLSGDVIVIGEDETLGETSDVSILFMSLGGEEYEDGKTRLKTQHHSFKRGCLYWQKVDKSKLNHDYVLYAIVPIYTELAAQEWEETMGGLYDNVIKEAERLKLRKITLPLLGSGQGKGPLDRASCIAVDRLFRHKTTSVQEISVVTLINKAFVYLKTNCQQYAVRTPQANPLTDTAVAEDTTSILEEEIQQLKDQNKCKICYGSEISIIFHPCRHLFCCKTCASKMSVCPVCRKPVEKKENVYWP